jgi:hypothetical protein
VAGQCLFCGSEWIGELSSKRLNFCLLPLLRWKQPLLTAEQKKSFIEDAAEARAQDFSEIAEWLRRRKITKLFHFTHINNLDSILRDGFQTRQYLDSKLQNYTPSDHDRLDGFPESLSFSIGKPNSLLLPEKNSKSDYKIVLLEVAANNLLTQNFGALPSNAANGYFQEILSKDKTRFVGVKGLKGMYLNEDLRKKASLPIEEPTDPQAEILFFEPIESSKIIGVHISERFPESEREKFTKIISDYPNLKRDYVCKCGHFARWNGMFRRYSISWENSG